MTADDIHEQPAFLCLRWSATGPRHVGTPKLESGMHIRSVQLNVFFEELSRCEIALSQGLCHRKPGDCKC